MEFFGKRFWVKKVTCLTRTWGPEYLGSLLNEIGEDERVVALAGINLNSFTGKYETGKEFWSEYPAYNADFFGILAGLQPSPSIEYIVNDVEEAIGGPFIAVHWRRGDRAHPEMGSYGRRQWKLSQPENMACLLNDAIRHSGLSTVFVATNSGTQSDRDALRQGVHGKVVFLADFFSSDWQEELQAMVAEIFLCSRASHFLAAGETLWTSSTISRIIYHMLAGKIRSAEHAGAMMLFLHDCSEQATANNASKLGDFSAQAGPEPVVTGQNTELERAENVEASERERGIGARASEIAPSAAAQDLPSRCRYSNILLRVCRPASVTLALLCQKSGAASAWRRGRGEPALAGADSGAGGAACRECAAGESGWASGGQSRPCSACARRLSHRVNLTCIRHIQLHRVHPTA